MGTLTTQQRRNRSRVERLIRLAEPGLNLILAVGDRASRLLASEDDRREQPVPPRDAGPHT